MEGMMLDPMSGQITFTLVALSTAVMSALDLFRYRPADTFYVASDAYSTTNWWKYANEIQSYGSLVIGSVAFIFQILSIFGIAADINIMVWMYLVLAGGMIVGGTASILRFYAYELAWSAGEDGNAAANAMVIREEMVEVTAMETATTFALWTEGANWWYAQMMALPEEKRDMYMEEKEDMLALFGF